MGDIDFEYNQLNQLIRSTHNGAETLYTYDNNGNLDTRTVGDYSVDYDWQNDGENRLTQVTIDDGGAVTTIEYDYNDQGIRVAKRVNGVETRYLVDELQPYAQVLEEYDAAGNLQAAYTYGTDLVSQVQAGSTAFYHVDGLGSTRLLTDAAGNVTDTYNYDAYGNLIGVAATGYLFAGEQREALTGLDYLRARYYDPTLGRFISADAYQGTLDDPMSLHDYQYAHANPVVNTDPSGYVTSFQEFAALSAITAIGAGFQYTNFTAFNTLRNGGSIEDAIAKYDQFFAGFADALTFGGSTLARRLRYGATATQNHSGLGFNIGRLAGAVTSIWAGSYAAPFSSLRTAPWWAKTALGYDLLGTGVGIAQSSANILQGKATWWDILPFLPFLFWSGANFRLGSNRVNYGTNSGLQIIPDGVGDNFPSLVRFSNLYPEDLPNLVPLRELFFDGRKWRFTTSSGAFTPNGQYNFVVRNGRIFIAREKFGFGGHIDIASGRDVEFAGQIRFGHGKTTRGHLKYWNNGSGHYRPNSNFAYQAPLPIEFFVPYQFRQFK